MVMSGSRLPFGHKLPQAVARPCHQYGCDFLIEINAVNGDQHGKNDSQFNSSHSQPRLPRGLRPLPLPYLCAASVLHPHSHHNRRNHRIFVTTTAYLLFDRTRRFPFGPIGSRSFPAMLFLRNIQAQSPIFCSSVTRQKKISLKICADRSPLPQGEGENQPYEYFFAVASVPCLPGRPARRVWDNAFHLFLHLTIRPFPEGPQITRICSGLWAGESNSSTSGTRPWRSSD